MKHLTAILLLSSLTAWAQLEGSKTKPYVKADAKKNKFGAALSLKSPAISVDEAISRFKENKSGPVLVRAKIDKVCQKKGCWMTLKSSTRDLRVIFKDYGFFVPTTIGGREVLAEGELTEKQLTLEETRHFVADAGGDPSKVTEPMKDYQFVATGVVIQ